MISPMPLMPIHPHPQAVIDDLFITPERERPVQHSKVTNSAFKTPALVNTSSSPGSSPMPTTITRSTHHPSALQQTCTNDDMASDTTSPAPQMLDAAFDFQPKPKLRSRTVTAEDTENFPSSHIHGPPKTPVTRSSAALNKTPHTHLAKTPLIFGSPARPPPSVSAMLSTPMWEVDGCLERMKQTTETPTGHGHGHRRTTSIGHNPGTRSPVPPTSPTRYAMWQDNGSPKKPGQGLVGREFTL
jgi:hypothetical protein